MRSDVIAGVMHFICSISANFRFCLSCTRVPTVWVSDYYFQMTLPITIGIQYVYVSCEILVYTQGTHPHHIQFVQGCDIRRVFVMHVSLHKLYFIWWCNYSSHNFF